MVVNAVLRISAFGYRNLSLTPLEYQKKAAQAALIDRNCSCRLPARRVICE
jgi:hypothetical protein